MVEETPPVNAPEQKKNTGMGVLCYLSILVLIPLLSEAKNDPFVKFHIKQGLVLFVAEVANGILSRIPTIGPIVAIPVSLVLLFLLVKGILTVVKGEEKPLPLIGQFADKLNI